jgi:hypothetical protein
MSQQDNFSSGFFWGAVLGGIAGGVVGALLVNKSGRIDLTEDGEEDEVAEPEASLGASRRRPLRITATPERNMETARQSLEDKIASLNDAIDDVRQQLHQVNGSDRSVTASSTGADDRSIRRDGPEETS